METVSSQMAVGVEIGYFWKERIWSESKVAGLRFITSVKFQVMFFW